VKRSVQAKFNTEVGFISSQILASRGIDPNAAVEGLKDENNQTNVPGFVRATTTEPKVDATTVANPDEIEVEDEESSSEEDNENENENDEMVESAVPKAVFGSLAANTPQEEKLGAKDRFKRKRG
jgi:pre-mRNA-splicing factor SYF1